MRSHRPHEYDDAAIEFCLRFNLPPAVYRELIALAMLRGSEITLQQLEAADRLEHENNTSTLASGNSDDTRSDSS